MQDRTTVQSATFNIRGQLYHGHANATVSLSSPVVSALGSSPGWGKALKMQAPLLGLAKSIYYSWIERGTVRMDYFVQKHNILSQPGLGPIPLNLESSTLIIEPK